MLTTPDPPTATLHFDFVDPLSFLMDGEVSAAEETLGIRVARLGIEINPPPLPLGTPDDPFWTERWERAMALSGALDVPLTRPTLVPWSRKAHELVRHAEEHGTADGVRKAIFRAFLQEGLDIGRVDVLVALAGRVGLDAAEAKAVLDVDRYSAEVSDRRDEALRSGTRTVPLLVMGARRLEGFHNRASLGTFLRRSS